MFRKACALARNFTWPVVISRRSVGGDCTAGIGTCVVINDDGWIVTAGHILAEIDKRTREEQQTRAAETQIRDINADATLDQNERRRRLRAISRPVRQDTDRTSSWFGKDRVLLVEAYSLNGADLGVGRLAPFDPAWVQHYPEFKSPDKNFEPGASLCCMGFPFHNFAPIWDPTNLTFSLPPEATPLPLFPIEGIFTRTAEIKIVAGPGLPPIPTPFPMRMVETSSPGIRGQSGGPIFDTEGRIWGIQSSTTHYPLDFGTNEKQYLNVGLGIHPDTIFGFLDDRRVKYRVSQD